MWMSLEKDWRAWLGLLWLVRIEGGGREGGREGGGDWV